MRLAAVHISEKSCCWRSARGRPDDAHFSALGERECSTQVHRLNQGDILKVGQLGPTKARSGQLCLNTMRRHTFNSQFHSQAGDFGTVNRKTGEFLVDGNIYTHQDIAPIAHQYPPLEAPETDQYQIHSYHVRGTDVGT
jgi:hypothetical protein